MSDAPWPRVSVGRDLRRARGEWLHTNGAGAYASSTIAGTHTRRYLGLLVAGAGAEDAGIARAVIDACCLGLVIELPEGRHLGFDLVVQAGGEDVGEGFAEHSRCVHG